MPRVAWQGGTHSQFNRADVAHVARGVADRYRKEQPHDRTVRAHDYHTTMRVSASRGRAPTLSQFAAAFRAAAQAAAIPRGSPRTRVDFGSRSQASRGAHFADLGRTGRGEPRAGGRGLTSREQLRDRLLTTPYASLEQPATAGNRVAQRGRSDARTAPRDGDTRRFGGGTGAHVAPDAQFDYLPPQYAKARQQARGGHMSIDAFLSSSRRQPLVPGGATGVHVDNDSASFSGDDVSATDTDDASAASVRPPLAMSAPTAWCSLRRHIVRRRVGCRREACPMTLLKPLEESNRSVLLPNSCFNSYRYARACGATCRTCLAHCARDAGSTRGSRVAVQGSVTAT